MSEKKIYIPGFANHADKIHQNHIPDSDIIQHNFRTISLKKLAEYIQTYWEDAVFEKLKTFYPNTTKEVFDKLLPKKHEFKWFTRDIETTISLTSSAIEKNLTTGDTLQLYGHSQWGLITMKSILRKPELLESISYIELLAPVKDFSIGRNFHKESIWYLHGKNTIVTQDYITSLEKDENVLYNFLELLKTRDYIGKVKLILWDQDPLVKVDSFDTWLLSQQFPFLQIEIRHGDHYLGY